MSEFRAKRSQAQLPPKIYGVMVLTTLLTFATLATGYQMFFTQSVFA